MLMLQIFVSFFTAGAMTFGGGYSMLPVLTREVVKKRGWISETEILDFYSISQCLPGLIAVNVSIFIGKKIHGISGAIVAMLGVVTPSIIVIVVIAMLFENFMDVPIVRQMFVGIRIAVGALITGTVVRLCKQNVQKPLHILLMIVVFILMTVTSLSPIWVILFAAPIGIFLGRIEKNA